MNIGAFKMNFTMKLGQCANDMLCGPFTCNMVTQNQPKPIKITSCQVTAIVYDAMKQLIFFLAVNQNTLGCRINIDWGGGGEGGEWRCQKNN